MRTIERGDMIMKARGREAGTVFKVQKVGVNEDVMIVEREDKTHKKFVSKSYLQGGDFTKSFID